MINADKPLLWKADTAASVDLYNNWFLAFAPKTYRESRAQAVVFVEADLRHSKDMQERTIATIRGRPQILRTLRMSTAPRIARDRLIGLAGVRDTVVERLEQGKLPVGESSGLDEEIARICAVIDKLLDRDLFPWLADGRAPTSEERLRAAMVVADRLCGACSDPIIRNAQEKRQLALISEFLIGRGYAFKAHPPAKAITDMEPGTFCTRLGITVGKVKTVKLPLDVVIQPKAPKRSRVPIFIEAKSAGDFTNVNKRRKEESKKADQLRERFGEDGQLILFLCGYFDAGYLGYEAADGIDWVWEHRITDLDSLGL